MAPATMLARKKVSKKTRKPWEGFWTPEQKKLESLRVGTSRFLKKHNIPVTSVIGKHLINLSSSDPGIRFSAIDALEKVSGFKPVKGIIPKVILPMLNKALNDPDFVVREAAEKAINKIKKRAAA